MPNIVNALNTTELYALKRSMVNGLILSYVNFISVKNKTKLLLLLPPNIVSTAHLPGSSKGRKGTEEPRNMMTPASATALDIPHLEPQEKR